MSGAREPRPRFESNPHGRLNLVRLAELEDHIGPLPGGYRQYLMRHNGGLPTPHGFLAAPDPDSERPAFAGPGDQRGLEAEIAAMFGIHRGPVDVRLARPRALAPDAAYLPIARLRDGQTLLLGLRGSERGWVFRARMPASGAAGAVPPTPVARSFAGLLALLLEIGEDARSAQDAPPTLAVRESQVA